MGDRGAAPTRGLQPRDRVERRGGVRGGERCFAWQVISPGRTWVVVERWGPPRQGAYDALVAARVGAPAVPRALVWGTAFDVLPLDRVVERRDGYLVISSPSNPTHYWGNLLLFDDPPAAGDGARWEEQFESEFGSDPRVQHLALGWDHVDGALGCAHEEFVVRGY